MSFFDKAERQLLRAIDEVVSKKEMQELSSSGIEVIRKRTEGGRGVSEPAEGNSIRFPQHQPVTKKNRKYLRRKGKLGIKTSLKVTPTRSNLIKTGEMIESLHSKAKPGNFSLQVSNSQAEKANEMAKSGRYFIGFTGREVNKFKKAIKESLQERLNRIRLFLVKTL